MRFQEIHGGEYDGAFEYEDLDGTKLIIEKDSYNFKFFQERYENWHKKRYG